jgi:glycosyltransferase involved in cell wall biosynthesis
VLFVNSGILGHRSVAALVKCSVDRLPGITAEHIDLSGPLSRSEQVLRRVWALPLSPSTGAFANLDLRRWRLEWHAGLLARRRIAAASLDRRVDVVHFHTQATAYASLAGMRVTPSIVSIDATQQLAREEMRSTLARLTYLPNVVHDALVFRRAATITATSEWAARSLVAHHPDCEAKVHVLPYPVRSSIDPAWVDARFDRSRRPASALPRALFIGGDFPRKGGGDLLEAWRRGRLFDVASLDLVTDWPLEDRALPPGVRVVRGIAPHTSSWQALWREADFFVMPSRHEAFGMVYQEAAAAGLPVVATRVNAIPEIVTDRVTGLLVDRGDLDGLVAAVRALAADPERRRRMGAAALERARLVCSLDRYASRLASIIEAALLGPPRDSAVEPQFV